MVGLKPFQREAIHLLKWWNISRRKDCVIRRHIVINTKESFYVAYHPRSFHSLDLPQILEKVDRYRRKQQKRQRNLYNEKKLGENGGVTERLASNCETPRR